MTILGFFIYIYEYIKFRGVGATNWPIVSAPDDEYGAFDGTRIDKGNRSTWRKPDLGFNPGLHGGKLSTNPVSYDNPFLTI
jgi:hypothetical protein